MQFDELKDQVAAEQILRVVFLNPERSDAVSTTLLHSMAKYPLIFFIFFFEYPSLLKMKEKDG